MPSNRIGIHGFPVLITSNPVATAIHQNRKPTARTNKMESVTGNPPDNWAAAVFILFHTSSDFASNPALWLNIDMDRKPNIKLPRRIVIGRCVYHFPFQLPSTYPSNPPRKSSHPTTSRSSAQLVNINLLDAKRNNKIMQIVVNQSNFCNNGFFMALLYNLDSSFQG